MCLFLYCFDSLLIDPFSSIDFHHLLIHTRHRLYSIVTWIEVLLQVEVQPTSREEEREMHHYNISLIKAAA